MKIMKIPQETINRAAHTDLIAYCQSKGIAIKRIGQEYQLKDYDSLYISIKEPYKWYRHSTGDGGKAIDFCIKFLGMNFRQAVTELTGTGTQTPSLRTQEQRAKAETVPELHLHSDEKRVIAYLTKKRHISYATVTQAIKYYHLRQDIHGNCAFCIYDNGQIVGAELHGTTDKRFKGQISKQNGTGYNIKINSQKSDIDWLCVFESAIDLLSFLELKQDNPKFDNVLLISMGGLKLEVIQKYKKQHPTAKILMCVDNDIQGKTFCKKNHLTYYPIPKIPKPVKDWNDVLKYYKNKNVM